MSAPEDPLEREADEIAEQVVTGRQATSPGSAKGEEGAEESPVAEASPAEESSAEEEVGPQEEPEAALSAEDDGGGEGEHFDIEAEQGQAQPLQRKPRGGETLDPAQEVVVPRTPGRPLESGVRRFMEERFGHSFARVRVHTDRETAASTERLSALAYTMGHHVYFGEGRYRPEGTQGRRLLAHELVHVLQQTGARGGAEGSVLQCQRRRGQRIHPQPASPPPSRPRRQAASPVEVGRRLIVNLGTQRTYAVIRERVTVVVRERHGRQITEREEQRERERIVRSMPITSGRPDHPTHPGEFRIEYSLRDEHHRSSLYGYCVGSRGRRAVTHGAAGCREGEEYQGAPMSFFQPFNGPEGFHQGSLSERSHGCVHLTRANAQWLWTWTRSGTPVRVCQGSGCGLARPRPRPAHSGSTALAPSR